MSYDINQLPPWTHYTPVKTWYYITEVHLGRLTAVFAAKEMRVSEKTVRSLVRKFEKSNCDWRVLIDRRAVPQHKDFSRSTMKEAA